MAEDSIGEGEGNFLKKGGVPPRFPTPSPNSTPSSSKTFVFIESLSLSFSGADCF